MTQPPVPPGSPESDDPGTGPANPYAPNPYAQNPYAPNPYAPQPQAPGQYPSGQYPQAQYPQARYAYGQAFPGAPTEPRPSQAMAVTALVLALFACTGILGIVSLVLAVIVLRRSRDGRNHGKGMAIAAIVLDVLGVLAALGFAALIAIGVAVTEDVNDLESGDCFNVSGLTSEDNSFTSVETVPCTDRHDAEVIATVTLSADQAERYAEQGQYGSALCREATADWVADPGADLQQLILTDRTDPDAGDTLACVVTAEPGQKLTEPVG